MSPDQIISYWKPEVAVRMVNDFTRYPIGHGEVIDRPSLQCCH